MQQSSLLVDIGQGLSMRVGFPIIESWSNKTRPNKAKRGTLGFNAQTNHLEYFDGTSWYQASMS